VERRFEAVETLLERLTADEAKKTRD
jgi:hypothetical protein